MFQSRIETNPGGAKTPEEQTFKTMIELASRGDDTPPPVSHLKSGPGYTYSQMMAQLIDQVKKEVDAQNPSDRWNGFAGVFKSHFDKLVKVQAEAVTELARLQKEEASKITSESYHDGFDVGYVNTPKPAPPPPKLNRT